MTEMNARRPNRASGGLHCNRAPCAPGDGESGKWAIIKSLRVCGGPGDIIGIVLALFDGTEEVCMFALSAILVGVIGVFYVRRRSSRKKQSA
jgi:hypothetical protein